MRACGRRVAKGSLQCSPSWLDLSCHWISPSFRSWYFSWACESRAVTTALCLVERPQVMSLQPESHGQHHWQSAAKPGHKDWAAPGPRAPGDTHLGGGAEVGASIPQRRPSWGSHGAIPPAWR